MARLRGALLKRQRRRGSTRMGPAHRPGRAPTWGMAGGGAPGAAGAAAACCARSRCSGARSQPYSRM